MMSPLTLLAVSEYFNLWIQLPLLILLIVVIVGYVIYRKKQM